MVRVNTIIWTMILTAICIIPGYYAVFTLTDFDVTINIEKPYHAEYNTEKQKFNELQQDYDILEEKKKAVCEYKNPNYFWSLMIGFFTGAFAIGYFILMGYPVLKDKLAKIHKRKK